MERKNRRRTKRRNRQKEIHSVKLTDISLDAHKQIHTHTTATTTTNGKQIESNSVKVEKNSVLSRGDANEALQIEAKKKSEQHSFVVVEEDTVQQCMEETTRRKEEIRQILARSYKIKVNHNIARAWPNSKANAKEKHTKKINANSKKKEKKKNKSQWLKSGVCNIVERKRGVVVAASFSVRF